jgi:type II secretory ATPase GspE/PulE/Tfp pilus assembly ATPase PilB-like protein
VRRLTADREEYTLSAEEISQIEKLIDVDKVLAALVEEKKIPAKTTLKQLKFYKPKIGGVSPDGYAKRVTIAEVLPVTHAIRDLIIKHAPAEDIEMQARKEGMLTMAEDGIFNAAMGITSIEEVLRVVAE